MKRTLQALWAFGVVGSFSTYAALFRHMARFGKKKVLLGHLSGLMNDEAKLVLLGTWMALFVVFTQPIKDDIGDKSVFMFMALPEDEKKVVAAELELENPG